jgi:quercetin 2,3-dioxygenase
MTKTTIRKSSERGHANHDWLESYHSFSFADYHDPAQMGFRSLRVLNQDRVAAGRGFPSHPHRDMEIFSYVLEGILAHQDSMGNSRELKPGQIQLMSAGSGVVHSEFNPSPNVPLHFLQIWIKPRQQGIAPSYTEWHPSAETENSPKALVISPDGRGGSAKIQQDADVYRVRLKTRERIDHDLSANRGLWLQLITGQLTVDDHILNPGDAFRTENSGRLTITAVADSQALLFDLA